jgi:hypothetical protein
MAFHTFSREDATVSKIIGMMLKENVHEVFIQLQDKSYLHKHKRYFIFNKH